MQYRNQSNEREGVVLTLGVELEDHLIQTFLLQNAAVLKCNVATTGIVHEFPST